LAVDVDVAPIVYPPPEQSALPIVLLAVALSLIAIGIGVAIPIVSHFRSR
jgi:hypothetical protein